MSRVKANPNTQLKHKKTLKLAKGYRGTRSKLFRRAEQAVLRAGEDAFAGRRLNRRNFRRLWIARISAALLPFNIKYSRFINALGKANIELDRKILSELAISEPESFAQVVEKAKESFNK